MGRLAAACALAAATALIAAAPAAAATLNVPSTANIFGAGHGSPPPAGACTEHSDSNGTLPLGFAFPAGSGKVLTFSSVTGLTHWGMGNTPVFPPDGEAGIPQSVASTAGISGIDDTVSRLSLTGVFLTDAEPADPAPARLSFGSHGFTTLSPLIEQGFFIGDGRTGTGSGAQQEFHVPASATRLFLGFMDGFDFTGPPGCYQQNTGTLSATLSISGTSPLPLSPPPPPPPPPPPEPDPAVGSVVEIKSKRGKAGAQIFRDGRWGQLGKGNTVRPGDRIRTDGDTSLAIELDLGGRVAVKPSSEIEVVGERSVVGHGPGEPLKLTKGGVWAKCGQMKESLEIQTTGGVIGIKG